MAEEKKERSDSLKRLDAMYPPYTLKLRKDIQEWIEEMGGKKWLVRRIKKLYSLSQARKLIEKRRLEHEQRFKDLCKGVVE